MAAGRREHILGILAQRGFVSVLEVAAVCNRSLATARRELVALEAAGHLQRTHGGALLVPAGTQSCSQADPFAPIKQRIPVAAAALVADGDTIGLSGGTTTRAVGNQLRNRRIGLVTNALDLALELITAPGIRVMVLGGMLSPLSHEVVGTEAEDMLARTSIGTLFVSVDGLSVAAGATCIGALEAQIMRAMAARARQVIIAADHRKIGRVGLTCILPLAQISTLITDNQPTAELDALRNEGLHDVRRRGGNLARIKLAYTGGGSTRAPGTMASFLDQGMNFHGPEIVLIDLNAERLGVVQTLARKMARHLDRDLRTSATTDRRTRLQDCDAVLTSFRPGGFEARYLDESIPLKHGVIGQETQGPGGFFMALRSIHVMQQIVHEMEAVCPKGRLFNYTNPINLVSEAITHHTAIPVVSLCEGPIIFPRQLAQAVGRDPDRVDAVMIGLNHGSWSVRHQYEGADLLTLVRDTYTQKPRDPALKPATTRMIELALAMDSIPSEYFQYYYFTDQVLAELQAKPTTRAQDILASVPDYWAHYREQAEAEIPVLNPGRSRGGIHELELAIDVIDAAFNNRKEVWPVNVPNRGALADFPDDLVVEVPGFVDASGVAPIVQGHLPRPVRGLVKMLGEYQVLAAEAAWCGSRIDAVRALASNPLVPSLHLAETLYDQMAAAHRDYLPERLLY